MAETGTSEGEGGASGRDGTAGDTLSRIVVGTRLSVYWPEDDAYYPGAVAERHLDDRGGGAQHVCTIRYDDGEVETVDLEEETFRLQEGKVHAAGNAVAKNDPKSSLSRIVVGTRLSVFWPEDDAYYPGVVAERHPERDGGEHVVTIRYDDGEAETVDLAAETFRILDGNASGPRGDRVPLEGPPEAFLMHDHEIYWGNRSPECNGWRLYFPDQDKIRFYSCSYTAGRCEVEWDGEGKVYDTCFRKARKRKRKMVDRAAGRPNDEAHCQVEDVSKWSRDKLRAKLKELNLPQGRTKQDYIDTLTNHLHLQSPSKRKTPPRKMDSVEEGDPALGPDPSEPHHITDHLGMTREEVISTLPSEMVDRFGDCAWSPWKGLHRPVFVLSPFDISGEGGMAEEWTNAYLSCQKRGTLSKMPQLVYWYETGWSTSKGLKSFSLVTKAGISSYEMGISRGWDRPPFIDNTDDLTEYEESILSGIEQMMKDQKLPKNQRGGPMFFPELREKERKAANKVVKGLHKRYSSWKSSSNYKACISQGILSRTDASTACVGELNSLELCSGEGVMSQALNQQGFSTAITLDNDPKRSATSQLSLEELEDAIIKGQIQHHPELNKAFSVIWAGPECRTWSRAQNGRYRNKDFIEGRGNRALEVAGQQARRDIESLVNILSFYKSRNPALVITIENPKGYLQHHPCSRLFGDVLGLELVQISYCQFSRGHSIHPQKNTHLWTNSDMLLHAFGGGEFECTPNKECIGRSMADGKHESRAQDMPGKCAAYPSEVCTFIAPLLFAEALKGTFGVRGHTTKRASTSSSLSLTDDET